MDPITVGAILLFAVIALNGNRKKSDTPPEKKAPQSSSGESSVSATPEKKNDVDLGKLANVPAVVVAAAVGGEVAKQYAEYSVADTFNDSIAKKNAETIGAATGVALFAGVGGTAGISALLALGFAGGVVIVVVPLVTIMAVFDLARIVTGPLEDAERERRRKIVNDLRLDVSKGMVDPFVWWERMRSFAETGYSGFEVGANSANPNFYSKKVPLSDGSTVNTTDLLRIAYEKDHSTGEEIARALEEAQPWLTKGCLSAWARDNKIKNATVTYTAQQLTEMYGAQRKPGEMLVDRTKPKPPPSQNQNTTTNKQMGNTQASNSETKAKTA